MLLTGLSACGGSTTADAPAKSDGTSKTETNKEEPKPQPADLTGTWKQTNSNDPSSYMEATISGDTIEYWSARGEGFKIFKHGETTQEFITAAPLAGLTPFHPLAGAMTTAVT